MTRDEYMKELAYLLQDIQDEDKEDALQYYRDYFDEAGPEKERDIITELGSPERIASMIRCDIAGNLEQGGEFTERGYQDERFRDPNYQLTKRYELPEKQAENPGFSSQSGTNQNAPLKTPPRTSRLLKIFLWIILILAASPAILGAGGGILGLAAGASAVLMALLAATGALTIAMFVTGISLVPVGIIRMLSHPLDGLVMSGTGLAFLGLGLLFLALSILIYGRFIPWLFRGVINGISRLFHRGRLS